MVAITGMDGSVESADSLSLHDCKFTPFASSIPVWSLNFGLAFKFDLAEHMAVALLVDFNLDHSKLVRDIQVAWSIPSVDS